MKNNNLDTILDINPDEIIALNIIILYKVYEL